MIVIADTTPIISLLKAHHLELIQRLYGNVLVPKAVYRELTEKPVYSKETRTIKTLDFLKMVPVENVKSVNVLR